MSKSKFVKVIAKHYKLMYVIGASAFAGDLIKIYIKGVRNVDRLDSFIDLFVDVIIYFVYVVIISVIRKKYHD